MHMRARMEKYTHDIQSGQKYSKYRMCSESSNSIEMYQRVGALSTTGTIPLSQDFGETNHDDK